MLKFELKKVFSKRINQMVIVSVFFIAVICALFAVGSVRYVDEKGELSTGGLAARYLAKDQNRWKGELTPEQFGQIVENVKELSAKYPGEIPDVEYGKTMQSYEAITEFIIGVLTPDTEWDDRVLYQLSVEQAVNIYALYQDNMEKMAEEYGTTPEKRELIKSVYETVEIPFDYEAAVSWTTIPMYTQTYIIILAVVIGFLSVSIFSCEFRPGTEGVFLAAQYGRSKAIKSKILAGVLMATIIYWVGMGILDLIAFSVMGTSGFSAPYQLSDPYCIYSMTYGEYHLLMLLMGYIASLFSGSFAMLITVKMRSPTVAAAVPFFMFCMLPFIGRMFSSFTIFFDFMPSVFSNIIEYAKKPLIFQIGGFAFRHLPFVALLYGALFIAMLPLVYRCYRRYGMRKHERAIV